MCQLFSKSLLFCYLIFVLKHVQNLENASCCSLLQPAKLSTFFQSSVLGVLIFSEIQEIKRKGMKNRLITKTKVFTASTHTYVRCLYTAVRMYAVVLVWLPDGLF